MLRKANKREETYRDGLDRMTESVKCTTTSYEKSGLCCKPWAMGEYSIPEFLKAEEDVAQ